MGIVGAMSILGLLILRIDVPGLFTELTRPCVAANGPVHRQRGGVTATAGPPRVPGGPDHRRVRVTGLLWAWAVGQYPELLPGVTVADAVATKQVPAASLIALGAGSALLIPSLWWLYNTFQREHLHPESAAAITGTG